MNFNNFQLGANSIEKLPAEILLDDCDLSIRAYQFLDSLGINNLSNLTSFSEKELLEKSKKYNTLLEIKTLLQEHGLSLKKDLE